MAEPTEDEFPEAPAEASVTSGDEEILPEEEPAATGAPPKTDEEVLAGVYHHLTNFCGSVDAATVHKMLTAPTTCAFMRTVGPEAAAGRLMGGKAAKAAAAQLLQSQHGELPVNTFVKCLRPLPRLKSSYCGVITYHFREQRVCDAFVEQFATQVHRTQHCTCTARNTARALHAHCTHDARTPSTHRSQAGGFTFAAETEGCNQVKLLQAVPAIGREGSVLSRFALYEEWDRLDSALVCGMYRAERELLSKGLGFDSGSGKLMKLQAWARHRAAWHVHGKLVACVHQLCMCSSCSSRLYALPTPCPCPAYALPMPCLCPAYPMHTQGEAATVEGFHLLAEDAVPGAASEAALLSYYDFKELAACDAWLAHYLTDHDGFTLAASFEGCAPRLLRAPPRGRTAAQPRSRITSAPPRLRAAAGATVSSCAARSRYRPRYALHVHCMRNACTMHVHYTACTLHARALRAHCVRRAQSSC